MIKVINNIYRQLIKLTYLGVNDDMSFELAMRTRYLNVIFYIATSWNIAMLIGVLTTGKVHFVFIVLVNIIFQGIAFILNINSRQFLAWVILAFGYTTYLSYFWIFLDSAWDMGYSYLVFIFLTFILFSDKKQLIIVVYVSCLYLSTPFIEPLISDVYKSNIETLPNATEYCFLLYLGLSSVLFTIYQSEIKKEREAQEQIIQNLQERNKQLNDVKQELEQFVNIVSEKLKKQLQVVKEENQKIDQALINKTSINQSLDIANESAQQMYVLVNEILE